MVSCLSHGIEKLQNIVFKQHILLITYFCLTVAEIKNSLLWV